jgi:hypothetical protein
MRPRFAFRCSSKHEGAGNAGCALHPRSRVQKAQGKRTRAYRFSGGNPAFPAQWLYGLLRALPGDRAFLSPSSHGIWHLGPVGLRAPPQDLTPASRRQDHTTSPYASAPFVLRAVVRITDLNRTSRHVRNCHDRTVAVGVAGNTLSRDLPLGCAACQ